MPRQQVEVEYGVTDRFTAGPYGVWEDRGEVVNDQEKERRLIPGVYWQLSRRT